MTKILVLRFYQALFVAWSVGTLTFILMRFIPGDVAYRIAAGRYGYGITVCRAQYAGRLSPIRIRPSPTFKPTCSTRGLT